MEDAEQAIESSRFSRMQPFELPHTRCFDLDGSGHRCNIYQDGDEWVISDYTGELARGATPAEVIGQL